MDEKFMQLALREASLAFAKNEVPVGAVAVQEGRVVARAHNVRETTQDPLGHAELLLLKKLAKRLSSWRLNRTTIYVTLEPCLMCMGALVQSRVGRLVFGAKDPKAGACGSLYDLSTDLRLNHQPEVSSGLLAGQCSSILRLFFRRLRLKGLTINDI